MAFYAWLIFAGSASAQGIETRAGNGSFGYSGNGGPATVAELADPAGVFADGAGSIYIADTNNRRIRMVDLLGNLSTVAGDGNSGYSGDWGLAMKASPADPSVVFLDGTGKLFNADTNNHRTRVVDPSGLITTLAGDGNAGFPGDGGPATDARLNFPTGVFVDGSGVAYIADRDNHRIRKVDVSDTITTVVGDEISGFWGDGGAVTGASLNQPYAVFSDVTGNLFIA